MKPSGMSFSLLILTNSTLISATDGAARILAYHLMSGVIRTHVELHQTGPLEGCSTD